MQYEIIDNFLDYEYFSEIKNNIFSLNFPWYYQPGVAFENGTNKRDYYFTHSVFKGHRITSELFELLTPFFEKLEIKSLIRCKVNFYPNLGVNTVNDAHRDYQYSHKGAILYINNNNGFTILEDGTKVESIENRVLFFDPSIPHSSTHCTDQKARLNINVNYF